VSSVTGSGAANGRSGPAEKVIGCRLTASSPVGPAHNVTVNSSSCWPVPVWQCPGSGQLIPMVALSRATEASPGSLGVGKLNAQGPMHSVLTAVVVVVVVLAVVVVVATVVLVVVVATVVLVVFGVVVVWTGITGAGAAVVVAVTAVVIVVAPAVVVVAPAVVVVVVINAAAWVTETVRAGEVLRPAVAMAVNFKVLVDGELLRGTIMRSAALPLRQGTLTAAGTRNVHTVACVTDIRSMIRPPAAGSRLGAAENDDTRGAGGWLVAALVAAGKHQDANANADSKTNFLMVAPWITI